MRAPFDLSRISSFLDHLCTCYCEAERREPVQGISLLRSCLDLSQYCFVQFDADPEAVEPDQLIHTLPGVCGRDQLAPHRTQDHAQRADWTDSLDLGHLPRNPVVSQQDTRPDPEEPACSFLD